MVWVAADFTCDSARLWLFCAVGVGFEERIGESELRNSDHGCDCASGWCDLCARRARGCGGLGAVAKPEQAG